MRYFLLLLFISFNSLGQEFRSYIDNANEADKICTAYAGKGFYSDETANKALDKFYQPLEHQKDSFFPLVKIYQMLWLLV